MRYFVEANKFLELPITSGTVQNVSNTDIEISNEQVVNSGLILKAGEMVAFNNATIYVTARPILEGGTGIISAVPFNGKGEGGDGGGSSYVLPIATASILGGVKSSSAAGGISVDATGKMTYNAPTSEPLSAPKWETNTAYAVNALVEYDNNLYMCLIAHTSGTFADDLTAGKWQLVSMVLQTATASVLGGVKSSNADGKITVNNDGTMTMNTPPLTAPAWVTSTSYPQNALVENSDSIYMCLVAHTSGTFADDLAANKWKVVGSTTYTLPPASASTLGGVKIGNNVAIDANGVLSATDTTYNPFSGATSLADGTSGLVPKPTKNDLHKFLCGDGGWETAIANVYATTTLLWSGAYNSVSPSGTLTLSDVYTNYDEIILVSNGQEKSILDTSKGNVLGFYNSGGSLGENYSSEIIIDFSGNSGTATIWNYGSGMSSLVLSLVGRKYTTNSNNYSTTEQRIGTWINGKPLYQKTISGTFGSGGNDSISLLSIGIDKIIEANGWTQNTNGGFLFFGVENYDTSTVFNGYVNANKDFYTYCVGNSATSYFNQPYYITIKYTKA